AGWACHALHGCDGAVAARAAELCPRRPVRAPSARPQNGGRPMSRLLPYPVLTASLLVMWLLLNGFSAGHLVLGVIVATAASLAMVALQPDKPQIRRWGLIPR